MTTKSNEQQTKEELYGEVYSKLINKVLPAFHEAVDELERQKYSDIGGFMINSMAGVTATVLKDAIEATAKDTGIPRNKARRKILKNLNELTNLFVRRLDERNIPIDINHRKTSNSI